ncbi:caspase family protein [Vandammella animalimorsus]|nr:caspase family protein [Vandammella animalimorsus]
MATYLLAIGVNRYDDRAFTALSCCENDAHEIHSLFKRTLGLGERARKLVGAVTLKDCKDELRRLGQQVRNGDTFVLFFAGHGYQHPRGEEQYLLFPEADYRLVQRGFADGMFSLSALCTLTDDWPGVQRVFVLDACRAWLPGRQAQGAVFHNQQALARIATRDPSRPMPARPGSAPAAAAPRARPPLILNATHDGQAAHELTHAGRGVLALALEQALEAQFQPGQPLWLGQALLHGVQERMQALLAQAGIGVEQSPLLLPADGQALLYQPPPAPTRHAAPPPVPLAPAAPAQPSPPSPPAHPPARPDTPATPDAPRQGWRFRHALIYGAISLACALPWVLWNARQYESAATRQLMHQAFSQAFSQASSQAARQDHGQWRQLRVFEGHEDEVNSVAFSPDGQLALSGSADDTLRLWGAPSR